MRGTSIVFSVPISSEVSTSTGEEQSEEDEVEDILLACSEDHRPQYHPLIDLLAAAEGILERLRIDRRPHRR